MTTPTDFNNPKRGRVLSVRLPNTVLLGAFDVCELCNADPGNSMSTAVVRALSLLVSTMRENGQLPAYESDAEAGERLARRGFTGRAFSETRNPAKAEPKSSTYTRAHIPRPGHSTQLLREISPAKNTDFAPEFWESPDFVPDFDVPLQNSKPNEQIVTNEPSASERLAELIESDVEEILEGERKNLLSKILVRSHVERAAQTEDSLVQTVHNITVKFVDVDDPRLAEDKFYSKEVDETRKKALRLVYAALPHADWSTDVAQRLVEQTILTLRKG